MDDANLVEKKMREGTEAMGERQKTVPLAWLKHVPEGSHRSEKHDYWCF